MSNTELTNSGGNDGVVSDNGGSDGVVSGGGDVSGGDVGGTFNNKFNDDEGL